VQAADTVDRMLDLTRRRAADSGVAHRVTATLADVNHLTYASNHFSLVLAIGVLPWLTSVYRPICERQWLIATWHPGAYLAADDLLPFVPLFINRGLELFHGSQQNGRCPAPAPAYPPIITLD
jgi:hypothetical protein